jgi:hypothetical protein
VQIDPNEVSGWIAHLTNDGLLAVIEKQVRDRRQFLSAETKRTGRPVPPMRRPAPPDVGPVPAAAPVAAVPVETVVAATP